MTISFNETKSTNPSLESSLIEKLPIVILTEIFKSIVSEMADPLEFMWLRLVNKRWNVVLSRNWFWEPLYKEKYADSYAISANLNPAPSYKEEYLKQVQIDKNINNNQCTTLNVRISCPTSCTSRHDKLFEDPITVFDLRSQIFELCVFKDKLLVVTCSRITLLEHPFRSADTCAILNYEFTGSFVSSYQNGKDVGIVFESRAYIFDFEQKVIWTTVAGVGKGWRVNYRGILFNSEKVFLSSWSGSNVCIEIIPLNSNSSLIVVDNVDLYDDLSLTNFLNPMPLIFSDGKEIVCAVGNRKFSVNFESKSAREFVSKSTVHSMVSWNDKYIACGIATDPRDTDLKNPVMICDRRNELNPIKEECSRKSEQYDENVEARIVKKFDNKLIQAIVLKRIHQTVQLEIALGAMSKGLRSISKKFSCPTVWIVDTLGSTLNRSLPAAFGNGRLFLVKDKTIVCFDYNQPPQESTPDNKRKREPTPEQPNKK